MSSRVSPKNSRQCFVSKIQARALTLIAACPQGMAEGLLLAHGVSIDDMIVLVRSGYATATGTRVRCGDQWMEVGVLMLTPAGREVIGSHRIL
jgi:hypothetical protein